MRLYFLYVIRSLDSFDQRASCRRLHFLVRRCPGARWFFGTSRLDRVRSDLPSGFRRDGLQRIRSRSFCNGRSSISWFRGHCIESKQVVANCGQRSTDTVACRSFCNSVWIQWFADGILDFDASAVLRTLGGLVAWYRRSSTEGVARRQLSRLACNVSQLSTRDDCHARF